MQRRQFLSQVAVTTASLGIGSWCGKAEAAERSYPFASAAEAFRGAGFDPQDEASAFFAVAADCHYGTCSAEGLLPIIEELNQMRSKPAFFVLDGDLITSASTSFGRWPSDREKQAAIEEFRACRRHLDRLDPKIRLEITLGNHDTHPGETTPDLFHEVFPGRPAYRSFDLAGIHFVLLNGHCDGRIDEDQRKWFVEDLAAVDRDREVVTFVHQPSLGAVVTERNIAPAYQQAFAEHRGPVWAICGHIHSNGDTVYSLPHTTVTQASVVCSGKGIWGGPERPGYWLYLLREGHVVGRVFRRLGHGFRLANLPDRSRPQPIHKPFEFVDGLRWKVLVGEGDREYLVQQEANDNVTAWCYVRKLVYRLPLEGAAKQAGHLAILGALGRAGTDTAEATILRVSRDRESWQALTLPQPAHGVYTVPIPDEMREPGSLYLEIAKPPKWQGDVHVAGLALLE